ncbi:MAG: hypothetical protein HY364_02435 [Candidatus Aenigmarchaeota archaeon]|nr:hypothetical protein [Candidatus Aenigmarchaeota archaeon]
MKGYIYTLEVLMTISIIAVTAVFLFGSNPEKPQLGASLMKERSFSALKYMDNAGILKVQVANGTESAIEGEIAAILPVNYLFDAEICTYECNTANVPDNRSVIAVSYYVSVYRDDFLGRKVKMWTWTP